MLIQVIGMGCDDCDKLYANVQSALSELELSAQVEKVGDLVEIVRLGVMTAPSLMVDGKLVVSGQVASVAHLKKLLARS